MKTKTCGECRFLIPEYDSHGRGKCYFSDNRYLPSCGACKAFVERYGGNHLTNGDKIRQMSNEELAVLLNQVDYNIQEAFHGQRDLFSSCYDMWLAWLNAPAESEVEDE